MSGRVRKSSSASVTAAGRLDGGNVRGARAGLASVAPGIASRSASADARGVAVVLIADEHQRRAGAGDASSRSGRPPRSPPRRRRSPPAAVASSSARKSPPRPDRRRVSASAPGRRRRSPPCPRRGPWRRARARAAPAGWRARCPREPGLRSGPEPGRRGSGRPCRRSRGRRRQARSIPSASSAASTSPRHALDRVGAGGHVARPVAAQIGSQHPEPSGQTRRPAVARPGGRFRANAAASAAAHPAGRRPAGAS